MANLAASAASLAAPQAAPAVAPLARCGHCGGQVVRMLDLDGPVLKCMQCSRPTPPPRILTRAEQMELRGGRMALKLDDLDDEA